jgi:hypothetical protein
MTFILRYDEQAFSQDVIARWGSVCSDLAEDENLLHPQMADLGRLCLADGALAGDILHFLADVLSRRDAISEIENAVAISFLEWPDLERVGASVAVPEAIARIVRDQWGRGGNY